MAAVAIAQPLLFRGTRPRLAAALVGAVVTGLPAVALYLVTSIVLLLEPWPDRFLSTVLALGTMVWMMGLMGLGALLGYATGGLMAGVFLVARVLLGEYRLKPRVVLQPLEPEDLHTLVEWLSNEEVRDSPQWRRAGFPADAEEFSKRLEAAGRQAQRVRRYKAVDAESGRMVGYAEIHLPDTQPPKGRLALACVAPDIVQRGGVGLAMVRELLCEAFERLGVAVVDVVLDHRDWQAGACYAQAGFRNARLTWREWLKKGTLPPRRRAWLSEPEWRKRHAPEEKPDT